ncbi:MAG: hypothetical protein GY774_37170 [Planctomycetes bacterium]|nr:hypothetical protein [Planctomycetota bacterium]
MAEGEIEAQIAPNIRTWRHLDFLGIEGTDANVVDNSAPLGTTIECIACYNKASAAKDSMVFLHNSGFPTN